MTYHNQRPQCPSLSSRVLLAKTYHMRHFQATYVRLYPSDDVHIPDQGNPHPKTKDAARCYLEA